MAKSGLKHIDVGAELTKTEWESEDSHEVVHGNSFPGSPVERQLFYRDDEHKWYIYNASAWVWLGGGGGGMAVHGNEYHDPDFEQQGVAATQIETHRTAATHTQPQPPATHKTSHQDGGADEISVASLSGELADLQKVKDHTHQSAGSGVGGKLDHGLALDGLGDDDHTQYIKHSLATAVSDFLVASGAGAFVKKTLAEVKTILGLGTAAYTASTDYVTHALATAANDFLVASGAGAFVKKTLAETKTILNWAADIATHAGLTTGVHGVGAGTVAKTSDIPSKVIALSFIIDGGGSAITTGQKGHLEIPFACTITGWTLLGDQSGSIVIDVWKDTYANFPPTVADTIAGSEKPTLSSAQKNQDLTLTTWTTSVAAGDILAFNVDSVSTVTRVILSIRAEKS